VLEYGRDENGRRLQASRGGFATRAEAQTALQDAVAVFTADVTASRMTVGAYLDSWLDSRRALKPKTRTLYADAIRHYLKPHLGSTRLLDLRAGHLDRMYAGLDLGRKGRPLSPSTVRRIHGVLRVALNDAVKRRLMPYNPAAHIELPRERRNEARTWSAEEASRFLRLVANDRLGPLYHLLLTTGLRRGEAVGLRWQDVSFDGRVLSVVQQISDVNGTPTIGTPKTKRGTRLVSLDDTTVAALRQVRDRQASEREAWGDAWVDTGLVFTREDGTGIRPDHVSAHFQGLVARTGLPRIRLHDLRHTSASLALAAGVDLKVVSERLGHSQLAITADLYTHVHRHVGQDAADRIGALLDSSRSAVPTASLPQASQNDPPDPDAGMLPLLW
jgi:integrase